MIHIPKDLHINGEIKTDRALRVDGSIKGNGKFDDLLLVAHNAKWQGNIIADIVIIEGTIEGEVFAREKIIINAKAVVKGKIITPKLLIEEGATLDCDISRPGSETPINLSEHQISANPTKLNSTEENSAIRKSA